MRTNITIVAAFFATGSILCLWIHFAVSLPNKILQPAPLIQQKPEKVLYLTFDMDMDESMQARSFQNKDLLWYDPQVFSYLEQQSVPATFFVSGLFAQTYPDVMRELASHENFSFQNHSYDESAFTNNCYWLRSLKTDQEKVQQIDETQTIIEQTTGQVPSYFRFPGLCSDASNNVSLQNLGYKLSNNGLIIAGDPFNYNLSAMVASVLQQAATGKTIVMHIGGPNSPLSFLLLQKIIPKLKTEGYVFEKL